MMHPRKLGYERGRLSRRQQAASPCPTRNGTTIGTAQSFTLSCGVDIGGNVLDSLDAFDLLACTDLCASFHPRCDGVTFDGRTCQLKARLSPGAARGSRRSDSAVGIFPGATSNCGTLGATQQNLNSNFQIMCGTVVAGSDLSQSFAPTFQDCMGQCAAASGCAGVSFDSTQDQGFKNCYLKTTVTDPSMVVADARVDTAMIQGAGNALPAGSSVAPAPGVATIPLPTPAASTGAIFFTPPGSVPSATISVGSLIPAQPTLVTELLPPGSTGISPTLFFPNVGSGSGTGLVATASPDSAAQQDTGEASSNAWIAAPVVGSVAAIALIVLSFIMLKRRRLGQRSGTSSSNSSTDSLRPRKRNISRPMAISSLFSSWLPVVGRRGDRGSAGSSGSRGRMGNFSEVTGKQPASRSSMRTSVTGLVRPGMAMGGDRLEDVEEGGEKRESIPQYDLKNGKMELRNSLNGLGQNRWS